jgi:hypothetical protein
MKKDCKCTDCKCGKQIEIGQNGEVVTISLVEYEDLLEDRKLLINLYKADGDTEKENSKD